VYHRFSFALSLNFFAIFVAVRVSLECAASDGGHLRERFPPQRRRGFSAASILRRDFSGISSVTEFATLAMRFYS
jgi:hypothetical protein